MNNLVESAIEEAKKILKDQKNKNAVIASTIAFYLSKENKERNAIIAGILAYTFLEGDKEDDKEDDKE